MSLSSVAREHLGVRWAHQGRSAEGLDCVGLVCVCLERVFGVVPPVPDYMRITQTENMLATCNELLTRTEIAADRIAVLGFGRQRHMGIIGENAHGLTLIHAYLPSRKVIEIRLDSEWRGNILAAYTMKKETT